MLASPPTMTTASSTANKRSSRSSSRKMACHGSRSLTGGLYGPPALAVRGVADDGGEQDHARERQQLLHPVDAVEDRRELVREEVRDAVAERHAHHRRDRVHEEEPPERDPGDARREEHRRAEPRHEARREHELHAVTVERLDHDLLAL